MTSDQYVTVERECPISTELDRASEAVMVNLGPQLGHGNTLRLAATDPETCTRMANAWMAARSELVKIVCEGLPDSYDPAPDQHTASVRRSAVADAS